MGDRKGVLQVRRALRRAVVVLLVGALLPLVLGDQPAPALTLSTTARPNADGTKTGWTATGCSTNFWDCVNDSVGTPDDDTTYIEGPNKTNSQTMLLQLTDMPADFVKATSVQVIARHKESSTADDTIDAFYQIFQSNETTAISAETAAIRLTANIYKSDTNSPAITGATDKATWDGARLRIRQLYTLVSTADVTSTARITAAEVNISYVTTTSPKLAQVSYIFENDDEDQAAGDAVDENTQQGAGNAALPAVKKGERLTARIQIKNTGDAKLDDRNLSLFYDRNDGMWSKVRAPVPPITSTGSCSDADFDCTTVESTGNMGQYTAVAVDPSGSPWVAHYDFTGLDLRVARYVGSGGTGCASSEWVCTAVDTAGDRGQYASMAVDQTGTAWVSYYDLTGSDLRVAEFVGAGGTGCAVTTWTCTSVDTTNAVGFHTSITVDSSGNPRVAYQDGTGLDLKVAQYVGAGGTGCAVTTWTCTSVDTTNSVGTYTSIAFDPSGNPWVSFRDATGNDLRVAQYVASGGTGCALAAWTCTTVDSANIAGHYSSLVFDPSGKAWVSYNDVTNGDLRVAQYVGSGGTGCDSAAWTCIAVDTAGSVGSNSALAVDPSGMVWVVERDDTNNALRLAQYVGSAGSGCASSAWTCSNVDTSADIGYASLAFGPLGEAWASYMDLTNNDLRVAKLNRGGEITTSPGLAGSSGDPLNESHSDMSSVSDAGSRDSANCTGGGTWNNGKWFDTAEGSGVALPAGNVTPQCTEVAFTIDTSQAVAGRTYRLVLATNDGWRPDKGGWRGPISVASGAHPTITMEAATTARYSKDNHPKFGACTTAGWGCTAVETAGNVGGWTSQAFGADGKLWISSYDGTNTDLRVARYVGSGGTGCASTAWTCVSVDTAGTVGEYTSLAIDSAGNPWISYYDNTNTNLKVARHVGSGGTGCASTAWTCTTVDALNNVGQWTGIAIDPSGSAWVSYMAVTGSDLKVAHFVGFGGTGCASTAWTCESVDTTGSVGAYSSIAIDSAGNPWAAAYLSGGVPTLRVARYVGFGGTGCAVTTWTCTAVDITGGLYSSIAFDSSGAAWVSHQNGGAFDLEVAKFVGSGGTGCASTAWTCTAVETAGSFGHYSSIAIDSSGNPWVSNYDVGGLDLKVARYVGSAGTGCASTAWTCTTVETTGDVGALSSLAFDTSGAPWVSYSYYDGVTSDLKVAKLDMPSVKPSSDALLANPARGARRGDSRYRLDFGDPPRGSGTPCDATPDNEGYCGVNVNDADYDSVAAQASERPLYVFARRNSSNATAPTATWIGKSTVAPSSKSVVMEIYRFGTTNAWEALSPYTTDTCAAAAADADCTVADTPSGTVAEYFEADGANYWAYFRVYQTENTAAETLKSDSFTATFGITNTAPDSPSSLVQAKTDDTVITTGGWTDETSVKFSASATDPDVTDTLQLCVEKDLLGTGFSNTEDACGTGVAYSGSAVIVTVTVSGLADAGEYHWQVRVKDAAAVYSGWVSYGGNAESARDFGVDTTAPSGGTVFDGTSAGVDKSFNDGSLSSLSANWSGFDTSASGLSKYEYSIGMSAGATDVRTYTNNGTSTFVTATGLTLKTSQMYFFNVRAVDNAGNIGTAVSSNGQLVAPFLTFGVAPTSVAFANLNAGNSYTNTQASTLATSTNGYSGYAVRAFAVDLLRSIQSYTVSPFNGGTYASPDSWQGGDTGFGYTSNDTDIQGSNKFQSIPCPGGNALVAPGCYAPFTTTGPGDIVADHTGNVTGAPITNEQFTVTYRVTVTSLQPAARYTTIIVYTNTVTF